MAFNKITDNLNIIQALDDEPNDVGGLTAQQLKAKFDEAANTLKARINAIVDQLMAATAASDVGFSTSENVPADNVQDAIENVQAQLQAVTQGTVANGSITTAKLDDDAVTGAKVADSTLRTADVNGSTAMTLASVVGASEVDNEIKLHYIRSLGMVFFDGSILFKDITNAGTLVAEFSFDHYAPVGGIAAFSSEYYGAAGDLQGFYGTNLFVELHNVNEFAIGNNMRVHVGGWYLCEGAGS